MIYLDEVTVNYGSGADQHTVFDQLTVTLPSDRRLAILGHPGSGKTTLAHLLAGVVKPDFGRIVADGRVSFPIGLHRIMRPTLTGRQNIRHVCDMYGVDATDVVSFVEAASEAADGMDTPFGLLPAVWRHRLVFSLGYAMPFETYVIDGLIGAGDDAFRERCLGLYLERSRNAGMIVTTRFPRVASRLSDCGAVLHQGRVYLYDDVADAIEAFETITPAQAQPVRDDEVLDDGPIDLG